MTALIVVIVIVAPLVYVASRFRQRVLLWFAEMWIEEMDSCVSQIGWETWNLNKASKDFSAATLGDDGATTAQETAMMLSNAKMERLRNKQVRCEKQAALCLRWAKS